VCRCEKETKTTHFMHASRRRQVQHYFPVLHILSFAVYISWSTISWMLGNGTHGKSWKERKNYGYQSYASVTAWLLLYYVLLVSRVTYSQVPFQWCCVTLLIERDNEKKIWMSVVCISYSITFMYYISLVLRFTYSSIQFRAWRVTVLLLRR